MRLLQIIGTLDPSYGGPIEALTQGTRTLQMLGHHSETVTLDDANAPWLEEYPGIVHALGPSLGKYRYNSRLVTWLRAHAGSFDAIIVRGIWQYQSFATWIASRKKNFPYFVFVHGALDPWFKETYPLKHLKKWLYWPWGEYKVLRDATGVLFTSEEERALALRSFRLYRANEIVVNYGTSKPQGDYKVQKKMFLDAFPQLHEKPFILFLSRIHPKKGIDILIEAFSQIVGNHPDLYLVIAGPDTDNSQAKLNQQAIQMGIAQHIIWTGMLKGDIKWGAFHAAEVFILPSHSENFGVVVAEALACSLPVLITKKVNIWQEVLSKNAGIVDSDTKEGIVHLLIKWLTLSKSEQDKMRINAMNCFLQCFEVNKAAENLIDTIRPLIEE
jgi:glycosyltransferase involved in cell wall biosynthesis